MRYPLQEAEDYGDEPPDEYSIQAEEMLEAARRHQDYLAEQQTVQAPPLVPRVKNDPPRDRMQSVTPNEVIRLRQSYGCVGRVGLYMKDDSAVMYSIKVGYEVAPLLRRFGRGYRGGACELVAVVDLSTGVVELGRNALTKLAKRWPTMNTTRRLHPSRHEVLP